MYNASHISTLFAVVSPLLRSCKWVTTSSPFMSAQLMSYEKVRRTHLHWKQTHINAWFLTRVEFAYRRRALYTVYFSFIHFYKMHDCQLLSWCLELYRAIEHSLSIDVYFINKANIHYSNRYRIWLRCDFEWRLCHQIDNTQKLWSHFIHRIELFAKAYILYFKLCSHDYRIHQEFGWWWKNRFIVKWFCAALIFSRNMNLMTIVIAIAVIGRYDH